MTPQRETNVPKAEPTVDPAHPDTRHVCCLSGGKDSTALAFYMRDRVPAMEYVFTDTGKELPETYEYLERAEAFLGKPIVRLNSERDFDHWRKVYGGFLPSARMRWCTRMLKIKPLERYIGEDPTCMYVGIRADEDRLGYMSTKPNLMPVFPFRDEQVNKDDVFRILEEQGIGLPGYYTWRTRSGCYFCFFQRKSEWVGLMREHPEHFRDAMKYEEVKEATGKGFTWNDDESLEELIRPERIRQIDADQEKAATATRKQRPNMRLVQVFDDTLEDENDDGCALCHL